jgi:hypothetical protein
MAGLSGSQSIGGGHNIQGHGGYGQGQGWKGGVGYQHDNGVFVRGEKSQYGGTGVFIGIEKKF